MLQEHGRSLARLIGDLAGLGGTLVLRLLKMVSLPLIMTSLLAGVISLGEASRLGRLMGRTIFYYLMTSVLAITTGILLVNIIRPGGTGAPPSSEAPARKVQSDIGTIIYQQIETLIPDNPFAAAMQGSFLSVIAFSILFGIFTILVGGKPAQTLGDFFQAGFEVMMAITMAIVKLAPFGVFFLMLSATATQGIEVFYTLGRYMLTVFLGLLFHGLVTLPLLVWLIARRSPWDYARAMSPALLTAFSSASSNATLPLTLSCAEKRAGISNRICSFVLPLGATVNMDGTALYEAVAVLFIAQLEPTIHLGLTEQILVAVTALLASIGAAGIPHAGLVMMVIVLQAVGLPADKVGIILAVDRVLDMCRTAINVWSDCCCTAIVARLEGEASPTVSREPQATGG